MEGVHTKKRLDEMQEDLTRLDKNQYESTRLDKTILETYNNNKIHLLNAELHRIYKVLKIQPNSKC